MFLLPPGPQAGHQAAAELRGHFLSIADTTGTIRLLSLPRHMHETSASEEADTRDFTVRETERLKFITGRGAEEKEEEKKEKDKEEVEDEEGEGEVEKKEILPPSLILFNKYKALEQEVLAKVGMTKKTMGPAKQIANLKALLKP